MSRVIRCLVAAVIVVAIAGIQSAQAADGTITVKSAADLSLPVRFIPPSFSLQPKASYALDDRVLAPLTGKTILQALHQHGLIAAYHGWINGPVLPGSQFVTYDAFAFSSNQGALRARTAYQALVVGTPIVFPSDQLPKSAVVWTYAGSDAKHHPYIAARVMFRVANVVGDVTGFYLGADNAAATTALTDAAQVVGAYVRWLSGRLPAQQQFVLPIAPLALVPLMRSRPRSRG